jgi:N-acetyl-anhydromuramyl-L-alanine amidase AmpD
MYKGKVFESYLKGYKLWADYEEAQVESLGKLLVDVCDRHHISKKLILNSTDYKPYVEEHAGIFFPCNVNRDSYSLPLPVWMANKLESQGLYLVR